MQYPHQYENGSAFSGFTGNTPWFDVVLSIAMLVGRYVPIIVVLALAGSFAAQRRVWSPQAP